MSQPSLPIEALPEGDAYFDGKAALRDSLPQEDPSETFAFAEDFIPFDLDNSEEPGPGIEKTKVVALDEGKSTKKRKIHVEDQLDHASAGKSSRTTAGRLSHSDAKKTRAHLEAKPLLSYDAPWLQRSSYSSSSIQRLNEELLDFVDYISPTEVERFARRQAIERITATIKRLFPAAEIKIFGSFDTELYLPSSDIDIVVILGPETTKPPLRKLARGLEKDQLVEDGTLNIISKARVPIIKFSELHTSYKVDISFSVESGIESAAIIKKCLEQLPALRMLTLVLKQFLTGRNLNEVFMGGIGSYSIMCLIVSFLQVHPLLQLGIIDAHDNIGILLLDFFELYGKNFNYEKVGISVRNGGSYFLKSDRDWYQERRPNLLCIEDPQDPDNDVAKSSFAFQSVRQAFEHAYHLLITVMADFDNSASGRSKKKLSLLSAILKIPEQTLRHRYYIEQTTNL